LTKGRVRATTRSATASKRVTHIFRSSASH
jgi:hypothetical protein